MKLPFLAIKGEQRRAVGDAPRRSSCNGRKERGVLKVDCRGCTGEQDLAEQGCLKGIIHLMAAEPSGVKEILLSRDWEIAYDSECASILLHLAEVVRFGQGLDFHEPFDGCSSCRSNPRGVASRVMEALPRRAAELDGNLTLPMGGHGRTCEQCVSSQRTNLGHMSMLMSQAEELINKSAFRVVLNRDR